MGAVETSSQREKGEKRLLTLQHCFFEGRSEEGKMERAPES
jgi:hypothetical protein